MMNSRLILTACLMSLAVLECRAQEAAKGAGQTSFNGLGEIWAAVAGRQAEGERAKAQKDAAQGAFTPKSAPAELKNGDGEVWARVEKGTANGLPASRVTTSYDHKVVIVARGAKVKSWDAARAACRAMAPAGSWDLPTDSEYMTLLMTEAVDVRVGPEGDAAYPMWMRSADEARNAAEMAGKSVLLAMADGKGTGLMPVDVGADAMRDMRAERSEVERALKNGDYRSAAEERAVAKAVDDYNRRNGTRTSFNLDFPHPGVFPDEINAILEKPRKAALQERQANFKAFEAAFGDGYPAFCLSR